MLKLNSDCKNNILKNFVYTNILLFLSFITNINNNTNNTKIIPILFILQK